MDEDTQPAEKEAAQEQVVAISKNKILAAIGALFIIGFFIFAVSAALANPQDNSVTGQAAAGGSPAPIQGGKQIVKMTAQGGTYYPNPIRVKKGVPVELDVDLSSVTGCLRGIQIPAFNVRKQVTTSDNKIVFTPDKAGTFGFTCFMGMGRGQLVVEDENGTVPALNTVAQDIPKGSSCGSGGGCGCGGG